MASISNRSNYVVTVEDNPQHTKRFPYNELKHADSYALDLQQRIKQGELVAKTRAGKPAKVDLQQLEDNLLVRMRDKGYPEQAFRASSYEDAEKQITIIAGDRAKGLHIDYTKGHSVTYAYLFDRYIEERCDKHKGARIETYTLNSFLQDVGYESQHAKRQREAQLSSGKPPRKYKRHEPRKKVEWLLLPFASVLPTHFDAYVEARKKQGFAPATIDREFDLISQVTVWATDTLRIHIATSPFVGFARPTYFNERNRRLTPDEAQRLLLSIREEDRLRSYRLAVETELARICELGPPRDGLSWNKSGAAREEFKWNKYFLMKARKAARATVKSREHLHIPLFEALHEYLLATTSRRSEALPHTWSNTHLEQNYAYYPDTKNNRSRDVPLRRHVVELLRCLPRSETDDRVFPITDDEFDGAWKRICKRAGVSNYHPHDNRHEGLSSAGEIGRAAGAPLNLLDLQALSGHRDVRMLARYSHYCAGELAVHMDELYQLAEQRKNIRKGRVSVKSISGKQSKNHTARRRSPAPNPNPSKTESSH